MFAVQFGLNDNYTVINFMFGGIFSDLFWGFTMLTDSRIEFGPNLCILTEIPVEFGWNHNLSTDILTANWSKIRYCDQDFDRNRSEIWISDQFRSKNHRSKTLR